ncbi:hypothetical protein PROFUN_00887 [Planoprotostelium fungivorum]|uniref:Uncharacterized protein n=1 Tax=Planoprotostelium fungivorum TaxID=1890364 RepID=A0A2P6P084_9EUKA|nr:hypothetical protein PROFUN_00887 [Planoprotostelium fungivorum]
MSGLYQRKCKEMQIMPSQSLITIFDSFQKRRVGIVQLDLSHKKLTSADAIPVILSLTSCNTLTKLNLSHNFIDNRACKAIKELLNSLTLLIDLDLSANRIGNVGAAVISEALCTNQTLKHLNLSQNQIGDDGMYKLSLALRNNPPMDAPLTDLGVVVSDSQLETLKLEGNPVTTAGVEAMIEALKQNDTVSSLVFSKELSKVPAAYALSGVLPANVEKAFGGSPVASPSRYKNNTRGKDLRVNANDEEVMEHLGPVIQKFERDLILLDDPDVSKSLLGRINQLKKSTQAQLDLISIGAGASPGKSFDRRISEHNDTLTLGGTTVDSDHIYHWDMTKIDHEPESSMRKKMKQRGVKTFPSFDPQGLSTDQEIKELVVQLRESNAKLTAEVQILKTKLKRAESGRKTPASTTGDDTENDVLLNMITDQRQKMSELERKLFEEKKRSLALEEKLSQLKQKKSSVDRIREAKVQLEKDKMQEQYDILCAEYEDHRRKHQEEFAQLYSQYQELQQNLH